MGWQRNLFRFHLKCKSVDKKWLSHQWIITDLCASRVCVCVCVRAKGRVIPVFMNLWCIITVAQLFQRFEFSLLLWMVQICLKSFQFFSVMKGNTFGIIMLLKRSIFEHIVFMRQRRHDQLPPHTIHFVTFTNHIVYSIVISTWSTFAFYFVLFSSLHFILLNIGIIRRKFCSQNRFFRAEFIHYLPFILNIAFVFDKIYYFA